MGKKGIKKARSIYLRPAGKRLIECYFVLCGVAYPGYAGMKPGK